MIGSPDEISIAANESIYVHEFVDQRAYVTKTSDSSSGYLPCSVIAFDIGSELNASFNELALAQEADDSSSPSNDAKSVDPNLKELALAEEAADPSSPPRHTKSQELPRPNPDFIKLKPKLSSARRFAFGESPTLSSPNRNQARASNDERETSSQSNRQDKPSTSSSNGDLASSQSRFEFGAASDETSTEPQTGNFLVRARKRQANQMESSNSACNVKLNQHRATIIRFSSSSRPSKHGSKPTLHYKYKGKNYKALWNSVSKKKSSFKCHDCRASTHILVPEECITFYRDSRDRKRFIIKADYKWDDKLEIMSQDEHTCRGRSCDHLDLVYEKIINHAKIYVNELKEPSRTVADDVLNYALRAVFTEMGEQYVERLFESNKQHMEHIRATTDKIDVLLKKKREETDSCPQHEDFSIYQNSLFEMDIDFFHETGMKLFYSRRSLKYMNDKETEVQIDSTFPFTKSSDWYQLFKIRAYKTNVSSLICYCGMKNKEYVSYASIMDRLKVLSGFDNFKSKIYSTDQEAALIKLGTVYFKDSISRTCSFHWVNGVKKLLITQGLKKVIKKPNLKSSNRLFKLIAKSWICIRVLPFMPPSIARKMIVFMKAEVESFPLSKHKLGFEEVLEKIHNDHSSATKLQQINWWTLLRLDIHKIKLIKDRALK